MSHKRAYNFPLKGYSFPFPSVPDRRTPVPKRIASAVARAASAALRSLVRPSHSLFSTEQWASLERVDFHRMWTRRSVLAAERGA